MQKEKHANLCEIIQHSAKWVAVLKVRHMMLYSPAHYSGTVAYVRNIRDSRYLYLFLSPVIRIVREGLCCALKSCP